MYVKKGLNYNVLRLSEKISSEYLFLEVILPDSKILVGAYYKAPKVKKLDLLEDLLLDVTMAYEDIVIVGDFNENYLGTLSGHCNHRKLYESYLYELSIF